MEMYHFITRWYFDAPIERVWDELTNEQKKAAAQSNSALGPGTVAKHEVRGSLPYTLRFTSEVTYFEPPRVMEVKSSGELVGTGKWVLEPRDSGTAATFYWDVGTSNPLFNFLAKLRFVRNAMTKNHDGVMEDEYRRLSAKFACTSHTSRMVA